jgi:hypothetical protein
VKLPERFRGFAAQYRWELVIAAGIVVFMLGFFGYREWLTSLHQHDPVNAPAPGALDEIFDAAALFVLGADQGTGMPTILEIARLLAPLVVGSAAVVALFSLSRDRLQKMRILGMRGHVVVCGLGQVGSEFLNHLRQADVVVIESDPANPNIDLCRSLRIPVIVGDAQREQTLRSAGVERAARLLAVGPSDAVNAEIVAVGQGIAVNEAGAGLRCLARIGDPELCALLRVQADDLAHDSRSSSLEFFNLDDIGARSWLQEFGVPPVERRPHILVSRLDGLGARLVVLAAARWCADRTDVTSLLWVTIVDDHAKERMDALVAQYPGVESVCHFEYSSLSVPDLRGLAAKLAGLAAPPLTRVFVTADTDEQALETALRLHQHFDSAKPLMVEMWQTSGVGRLIGGSDTGARTNITLFPSLKAACTSELVQGGSFEYYEPMAVEVHEQWRKLQTSGKPATKWQDLDEILKESSRAQARDIPIKLRKIKCDIDAIDASKESAFAFTDDEIEFLAREEHKRWIRERIEDGWQPVDTEEEKDRAAKKTPYMVPFDDLPENIADYDRNAVQAIPEILKSTGQRVVRVKTTEHDASPPAVCTGPDDSSDNDDDSQVPRQLHRHDN